MLLCMTDLLGLLLSTILVLLIELIESALEHLVDILRYINVYVLLLNVKDYIIIIIIIIIVHIYIAHYSHCALTRFLKNSYTLTKYT